MNPTNATNGRERQDGIGKKKRKRNSKTHTKGINTITQARIAQRDLPQYLIALQVTFQKRPVGLFQEELVYHIE